MVDSEKYSCLDKSGLENVVQTVLGPEAELLTLPEFLVKVPPMPLRLHPSLMAKYPELQNTIVHPLPTFCPLNKIKFPLVRFQSLSSLVDDIVWDLVQRREKQKASQGREQHRNLLCTGYIIGDEFRQSMGVLPNGPKAALAVLHINNCVDYCKTSEWMDALHEHVGDDIMRSILLHCSVFVPIESDWQHPKGNFLQIAGPPARIHINVKNSVSRQSRKRRRRSRLPEKPETLHARAVVNRKSLFYSNSFVPAVGLPSNHCLNDSPTPGNLLKTMLGISNTQGCFRKRWKRARVHGINLSEHIIRGHSSCDYHRLLERYCPLPYVIRGEKTPALEELSGAHSAHDQVISFLRSVICRVFPLDFWGSAENRTHFFYHQLETFVRLRRQEAMPNKTLLHGLRVTKIKWLHDKSGRLKSRTSHHVAEQMFLATLRWLLGQFIIPLLSTIFHVTETEFGGKKVVFYRKPVWTLFRNLSMKKLLSEQYTEISGEETWCRLTRQQMGISRLRLLPKATGVRPIATLCKREKISLHCDEFLSPDEFDSDLEPVRGDAVKKRRLHCSLSFSCKNPSGNYLSTNSVLNDAFCVLRREHLRDTTSFGAGLDGLHYFYPKYRKFLLEWKTTANSRGPLLFGSIDIHHCYDNINQMYLLQLLDRILVHDDYLIQRFRAIHPFPSLGRVFQKQKSEAGPPDEFISFSNVIHRLSASQCHQTMFVDRKGTVLLKKKEIMAQLQEHLTSHLVVSRGRYGNRYFLQSSGIPQGSVLSTLLCNFYYAEVERLMLGRFLDENKQLLVRMVDDFMICTSYMGTMKSFLSTMLRGDNSLGVAVNEAKTKVSIEICTDEGNMYGPSSEIIETRRFPWCGMLFNIDTGEVMIDYSRFHDGKGGDNLTIDRCRGEGTHLFFQMKTFVRPRCIPILFDSSINTWATQVYNFYQLMVFAAVKTAEHIQSAHILDNLLRNQFFVVHCINSTTLYAYGLIRERLAQMKYNDGIDQQATCTLKKNVAQVLGWRAFDEVFAQVPNFGELHAIILQIPIQKEGVSTRILRIIEAAFIDMQVKHMLSA